MADALHTPDRAIVRQLQEIDPNLSVGWIDGRWAVFDGLQVAGHPEEHVRAIARELAWDFRAAGYEVPFAECLRAATDQVEREKLVCVVQEDDGGYRPLDGRIVDKFRRMDWFRRNFWARDFVRHAQQQSRKLEEGKRRDRDNLWSSIANDKVFARMVTDLRDGYHAPDSISFRQKDIAA